MKNITARPSELLPGQVESDDFHCLSEQRIHQLEVELELSEKRAEGLKRLNWKLLNMLDKHLEQLNVRS